MIDIEKVAKGLYACTTFGENGATDGDCNICPYNKGYKTGECWVQMNRDALQLLKEQKERIGFLERSLAQFPKSVKLLDAFGNYEMVVRCKECKNRDECEIVDGCVADKDWFCADGERKSVSSEEAL